MTIVKKYDVKKEMFTVVRNVDYARIWIEKALETWGSEYFIFLTKDGYKSVNSETSAELNKMLNGEIRTKRMTIFGFMSFAGRILSKKAKLKTFSDFVFTYATIRILSSKNF